MPHAWLRECLKSINFEHCRILFIKQDNDVKKDTEITEWGKTAELSK